MKKEKSPAIINFKTGKWECLGCGEVIDPPIKEGVWVKITTYINFLEAWSKSHKDCKIVPKNQQSHKE